jgi:serine/threonine protein kinase
MSSILQPGSRLGKYEVVAHLATGGMGTVYRAVDTALRRTVALKVLPAHLAQRPAVLERFRREARHAARLRHPHIVTLFEYGHDHALDLHYLTMELVEGEDLSERIARMGRLPPEDARRILIQAAQALDHAAEQGVVHRDIKPSNFLLTKVGGKTVVKLTDLGLALAADDDAFKVTTEGSTVGTIDYMAPEQARDSRGADVRSDLYSLGCTAYHMLAGQPPFGGGGLGERLLRHLTQPPPDVRQFNPAVSAGLWAVLQKMLAKKPEDRFDSPAALLRALKRVPANAAAEGAPAAAAGAAAPTPVAGTRRPPSTPPPTPPPGPAPSSAHIGPLVTPEQARAALAFHERAVQVIAEGGGDDYARELLANCLRIDPFTPAYRKTLRELNGKTRSGLLGRWLGSLNVLALKAKLRSARSAGDWRRVLEHGEEVLARQPADAATHIEMAAAARELGLSDLALWLLQEGREAAPNDVELVRAMARLQEHRRDLKRAIALWEQVLRRLPGDEEARRMIDELAVRDHMARARYRR